MPVSEMDRRNVTLFCDVRDGNPATLVSVRWYFGGELLKQVRQSREMRGKIRFKSFFIAQSMCSGSGPFEQFGQSNFPH